jgi:two-component system OmpR family sensor kinase
LPGLRSLRNRLALIFALIIAGAIGTIYLSVTPRLEASLTSQRLNSLVADSKRYVPRIAKKLPVNVLPPLSADATRKERNARDRLVKRERKERDDVVQRVADLSGAEVIAYTVAPQGPLSVSDSKVGGGVSSRDVRDLAVRAIDTKREVTHTGPTSAGEQALVAQPTFDEDGKVTGAAVFASSLADVQDNVALIRRQVLLSGGIALVIAVLAGYLVARALAARVKRLERAARKVASGDFSQPIRADSDDELG